MVNSITGGINPLQTLGVDRPTIDQRTAVSSPAALESSGGDEVILGSQREETPLYTGAGRLRGGAAITTDFAQTNEPVPVQSSLIAGGEPADEHDS